MKRNGLSLVELIAATLASSALMAMVVQYVSISNDARGADRDRTMALQEAQNVMETLFAMRYDELDAGLASRQVLSAWADQALPAGKLNVSIEENTEAELRPKKILVEVRWKQGVARAAAPVRLVAWRYPTNEQDVP